jgi:multidrug efflux system outer membrane protein
MVNTFLVHRRERPRLAAAISMLLLLAGCSFAPLYERPAIDLPESARQAEASTHSQAQWWRRFNDPRLNDLVREALSQNRDILAAGERIEQAAALAHTRFSDLFPRPSAEAQKGENRSSSNVVGGAPPNANRVKNYTYGITATWELDFWGKYRNAYRSASVALAQSAADRDALALLVTGNVVKAYSALLTAREKVRISGETVAQREKAERLQKNAFEIGTGDEMALLRTRGELEQARYSLVMARRAGEYAASALCLLLGRSPAAMMEEGLFAEIPSGYLLAVLTEPPARLDFKLLEQRPDLRAAEYALMAEYFNIGVIRADYLPSVSISASLGSAAKTAGELGAGRSTTWSVLDVLRLPLDFWNTHFRELMAEARSRERAHAYEKAVQNAFHDVRDALRGMVLLQEAGSDIERQEKELARAVEVAGNRYRYGYADYMDVLDAGRSLLSVRLNQADHRHDRIVAEVDLHMALGGGWSEGGYMEKVLEDKPVLAQR